MDYADLERAYLEAMKSEMEPAYIVFSVDNPPMFIVDALIADLDEELR